MSMTFLFVVGAAVVALVTLRRGAREGAIVLLWSLLPATVALYVERDSLADQAALSGSTMLGAAMLGCWLMACMLRQLGSWPLVLLGCTLSGLATTAIMPALAGAELDQVATTFNAMRSRLAGDVALAPFVAADIRAILGASCGYFIALGALLGRYWQAALFNPGGFQQEFHALRLPLSVALIAVAGVLWSMRAGGYAAQMHIWLFVIPLLFAGLARVHSSVAQRRYGPGALALVYTATALFPFVKFALAGIGLADSLARFANHLRRKES